MNEDRESGIPYPVTPDIDIETGHPIVEERISQGLLELFIDESK